MAQYIKTPIINSIRVDIRPEAQAAFSEWQAKVNAQISAQPGFVSLEFISPTANHKTWLIVQRFSTAAKASEWLESYQRKEMMDQLKALATLNGIKEVSTEEADIQDGVTEVIVAEVAPHKVEAYQAWSGKIHLAEAQHPGFRGVYVQSPAEIGGKYWITLLQFDTMANLDNWLTSPVRQALLEESAPLISSLETHRVISPYAGWFSSIVQTGEVPAAWKQTMIVLLVLFPTVMFEMKYLNPLLVGVDVSFATFISNAISVTLLAFPLVPIAICGLRWWLSPNAKNHKKATVLGTAIVLGLYALEIALLWHFL